MRLVQLPRAWSARPLIGCRPLPRPESGSPRPSDTHFLHFSPNSHSPRISIIDDFTPARSSQLAPPQTGKMKVRRSEPPRVSAMRFPRFLAPSPSREYPWTDWTDASLTSDRQLNISYPANGSQKLIDIEDERKLAVFMEKRVRRRPPPPSPTGQDRSTFLSSPPQAPGRDAPKRAVLTVGVRQLDGRRGPR